MGNAIYDQMKVVFRPSKGLCFPNLITKLCHEAGLEAGEIEEIVKLWLPIFTRTISETQPFPSRKDQAIGANNSVNALMEIKKGI